MPATPPSASSAGRQGASPQVATFLTLLVPGAGHLYLGRRGFALVAFLVVEGLFLLGLALSGGMTFEFLDPELRGRFATLLTPEVGNLGGLLLQMQAFGYGPGEPRPWPDAIRLGSWLTAVSGLANVLVAVHAHLAARPGRGLDRAPHPAWLVGLAWLVPGLGHLAQGRRRRALVVFVLLVGLFSWGTWLAEASNLSRERHFYYWSGQFLVGLPAALGEALLGATRVTHEIPLVDVGLLFGCLAGLLNVLAMLDVYGVAEARWLGAGAEPSGGDSTGPQEVPSPSGEEIVTVRETRA